MGNSLMPNAAAPAAPVVKRPEDLLHEAHPLNESERAEILQLLRDSREALLEAVAGLSPAQSAFKLAPDHWSVLECVEHVALSEDVMFRSVAEEFAVSPPPESRERETRIVRGSVDRSRKFTTPEAIRPSGRFASLPEAVAHFRKSRERTIAFVETCREDLRCRASHHPLWGPLTGHECLLLLAVHPARHAEQIREVLASPGFPETKKKRGRAARI